MLKRNNHTQIPYVVFRQEEGFLLFVFVCLDPCCAPNICCKFFEFESGRGQRAGYEERCSYIVV